MNFKSVRLFNNSQRQLSQEKVSPTLHSSTENVFTNNNLSANKSQNAATNDFLVMFESEVKKHWGV